ncbi:unnamed protein product, partial [Rotaria sp. Silwood2]
PLALASLCDQSTPTGTGNETNVFFNL